MFVNTDIFKIETNHAVPAQGKVLISEPFLCDRTFGRSVILLVDHTQEGTMGLVLNKRLPFTLDNLLGELGCEERIPVYKGGPLSMDTLFYLHTMNEVEGSLPISKDLYLNGDFEAIKAYIAEGRPLKGKIRFFLGYAGWESEQLRQEIDENTWLVGKEDISSLMNEEKTGGLWKRAISKLGEKYEIWSHFPQIPTLN